MRCDAIYLAASDLFFLFVYDMHVGLKNKMVSSVICSFCCRRWCLKLAVQMEKHGCNIRGCAGCVYDTIYLDTYLQAIFFAAYIAWKACVGWDKRMRCMYVRYGCIIRYDISIPTCKRSCLLYIGLENAFTHDIWRRRCLFTAYS